MEASNETNNSKTEVAGTEEVSAVPDGVFELCVGLTVQVMAENPENIPEFSAEYFKEVKREIQKQQEKEANTESINQIMPQAALVRDEMMVRRKSVRGEPFDLRSVVSDLCAPETYLKSPEEKSFLTHCLRKSVLFRHVDCSTFSELIDTMRLVEYEADEKIIKEPEIGNRFHVVESGVFEYTYHAPESRRRTSINLTRGETFGDLFLLYPVESTITVFAVTDGSLWTIDRITYRNRLLRTSIIKRKTKLRLINYVGCFKNLSPSERCNLADALKFVKFSKGNYVFKENDSSNAVYLVEEGLVSLTKKNRWDKDEKVQNVGMNGFFGELALLKAHPRPTSALVELDCSLYSIDCIEFERIFGTITDILKRDMSSFTTELQRMHGKSYKVSLLKNVLGTSARLPQLNKHQIGSESSSSEPTCSRCTSLLHEENSSEDEA